MFISGFNKTAALYEYLLPRKVWEREHYKPSKKKPKKVRVFGSYAPEWKQYLVKTSAFDHNNQGLEFKMSDQGNPMVGPGGMSPSGIPSYQGADDNAKNKAGARKRSLRETAELLFNKTSGISDASLSDSGGSDIAPTTASQLKWTSQSGPTLEEEADDRKEQKNRRKTLLKTMRSK